MIPQTGDIVRVRSRQYLVEGVDLPPQPGDSTLVRLSCLEDDAQGERLPPRQVGEWKDRVNRLPNLQLLDGAANNEKNASLPLEWVTRAFPEADRREAFIERHRLGKIPESMAGFPEFYDARRAALLDRLRELLSPQGG